MMTDAERQEEDLRERKPLYDRLTAFESILLLGGLVMFLVLIYEMHTYTGDGAFINPILIAVSGTILLWPIRAQRAARTILLSGGFLLLLWIIDILSGILVPFFVVYLLAFLFDPIVTDLNERRGIPRGVSSLVITLTFVGAVVLFVFLLVPNIIAQLETLATRAIVLVGDIREWLLTTSALDEMERSFRIDKEQIVGQLAASIQERMAEFAASIPQAAQRVFGYIGSLLVLITTIAIIPVMLYYTLKDYPWIKRRLVELFPTFGGERDYLVHAGSIMGNYLRGQLTISAIAAFNVSVALILFNVPFALLIGLMAGVLNMIPNLGAILTNIFAVLLAVVFGDPWLIDAVIVFLVLLGQSLLEQSVLTPKILSSHVGLHPVLIILSLLVFGYFMGILGFLIAVPATALIMTLYKSFRPGLSFELSASGASEAVQRKQWRLRKRARISTAGDQGDDETLPPEGAPSYGAGDSAQERDNGKAEGEREKEPRTRQG